MSGEIELQATTEIEVPMIEAGGDHDADPENLKDDRPEYKQQISAAINAIKLPEVCKFDANYIEAKLYEFDELLGGNIRDFELEKRQSDPFNTAVESITELLKDIRKKQNVRTEKKRAGAKQLEIAPLHDEIETEISRVEEQVSECHTILRSQTAEVGDGDREELETKENTQRDLKELLTHLKTREAKSSSAPFRQSKDEK